VRGKRVVCFTDAEEKKAGFYDVVPFHLEQRLRDLGAKFEHGGKEGHAVRDGRLVTGQNPPSATRFARLVLEAISDSADVPAELGVRGDALNQEDVETGIGMNTEGAGLTEPERVGPRRTSGVSSMENDETVPVELRDDPRQEADAGSFTSARREQADLAARTMRQEDTAAGEARLERSERKEDALMSGKQGYPAEQSRQRGDDVAADRSETSSKRSRQTWPQKPVDDRGIATRKAGGVTGAKKSSSAAAPIHKSSAGRAGKGSPPRR